jgi:hypothetical protein
MLSTMNLSDSSVTAAVAAAQDKIRVVADGAVVEVANNLLVLMKSAGTYRERGQLAFAQIHILESRDLFLSSFATALRDRVNEDIAVKSGPSATAETTDWQSISLVDEGQIEERISFERIGQMIAHRSESELRELDGYMSSLLRHSWADPERNPLRGAVLGLALHKAIEKITEEPDTQKIFGRELGQAMANAMPTCYREIVADLKQRAVRPTDVALRPVDDGAQRAASRSAASSAPGAAFEEARKAWEASWIGRMGPEGTPPPRSWESSILGRLANVDPAHAHDPESSASLLDRLIRGGMPGSIGAPGGPRPPAVAEADAELMSLLRRLNGGASYRGEFDRLPRDTGYGSYTGQEPDDFVPTTRPGVPLGSYYVQPPSTGLSGLMAANLIRAHRDELMQASRGKLDHLVIEVVSSLFDQILSDARVPPQMARQIARLQLPVLRAALTDGSFFSSRRHPVRRFINRVASLACAFDSFDGGPGQELLERVGELVKEIVEGDFDQLQVYDAKLFELERFVAEQTHAEIRASSAAATLRGKELEWRVQQHFNQRLRAALEPLALPDFVRDFLCGVWAQAIVTASRRDGPDGPYPLRLRRAGAELVTSIQPKRSLEQRRHFVASLPALMAELTRGMKFVDWPDAAQDDFFGQLITQHAGSLKGAPRSDLDHNMMVRHLEAAFRTPVPSADEAAQETAAEPAETPAVEQRFSADEERAIGLISESEVDWTRELAVDGAPPAQPSAEAPPPAGAGDDIPLPTLSHDGDPAAGGAAVAAPKDEPAESPELAPGRQLREHLQLGFSYQLNLKDQWEKVRLTYMSPARSLFLFAHGAKGRETISMTARTLGRLCEAGRMRAFENAFLIDRATQRARQQLAAAGAVSRA